MESSFTVWHMTAVAAIHCLTVAHCCKVKKKNHPQTIALSANHIVPFVIIQNPQYSGAWHTGLLYLATFNSINEDKGYPSR